MIELGEPFKLDKNKIWYLDSNDVTVTPFSFNEFREPYAKKRKFYHIEGINDYIIKDLKMRKYFLNEIRTARSLLNYIKIQDEFNNIEFPIGYYKDNDKMAGTIIPYYPNSISLQKISYLRPLDELKKYYNKDENSIKNLISLLVDILDIIVSMYEKDMVYLDIHAGNFLLYENKVKVIDFELNYVLFTTKKRKYYHDICRNYIFMAQAILRSYGFNIFMSTDRSFMETREDIIDLERRLCKKNGI